MTYLYLLFKEWKAFLIAFLSFAILILLLTGTRLEADRDKAIHDLATYKQKQEVLVAQANAKAKEQEVLWATKLYKVEQNAIKKINEASDAKRDADAAASRLSKQLSTANERLSKAPRETIIEYTVTNNTILEECVFEYRKMAETSDGHAIDAERLINSFPTTIEDKPQE